MRAHSLSCEPVLCQWFLWNAGSKAAAWKLHSLRWLSKVSHPQKLNLFFSCGLCSPCMTNELKTLSCQLAHSFVIWHLVSLTYPCIEPNDLHLATAYLAERPPVLICKHKWKICCFWGYFFPNDQPPSLLIFHLFCLLIEILIWMLLLVPAALSQWLTRVLIQCDSSYM